MAIDDTDEDSLWVLPGPHPNPNSNPNSIPNPNPNPPTGAPGRASSSTGEGLKLESAHETALQSGDLIADRFEIGRSIGQGGMGTVFEARDSLRGETVAIKVLVSGLLQDREAIRQFQSEAAIATRLSHPHIVTVYDLHVNDGAHAIVMERLRGKTLRDEIRERKSAAIPFAIADIESILGPVCQALDYAHAFTVHRDVKPENIWIGDDGTVKLMDFGLAMLVQRDADPLTLHTLSQLRLGSPYYMAPEQLQDARKASAAADQFAVGVIAYELLSGSLPIGLAKPLRELRPDLPYPLTDAVDRALATAPESRFPSVAAFWEAFQSGCRCGRSWRQYLDTRPLLRKSLLTTAAVGTLALLTGWGFSLVNQRATTLLDRTGEASNALLRARLEISTVRQLFDEVRRDHLDTEFALKAVRATPAPRADDVPAVLQREFELARAEQDFAEAERVWQLLVPRLSDERTPLTLTNRLGDLEDTLRTHDFDGFARARALLEDEIANEREVFSQIKALSVSQVQLAALNLKTDSSPAGAVSNHLLGQQDPAAASPPSDADLRPSLEASIAIEDALAEHHQARFDTVAEEYQKALARWQALFPGTGPPPIEFLAHPTAKAKAAHDWQSLKHYNRAVPLLTEVTTTLNDWAKEIEDLHERCDDMWSQAQKEGRAFENILGMRFVQVGEGETSHYWSIWETRVMDFAWYVSVVGWGSENAGTFWKDPGFPIGPTHPVVGIDPELAGEFGRWIAPHFQSINPEGTYELPTIEMYEALLDREPVWQASSAKRAVFPDNNRLKSRHWMNRWADPDISPERHLRPVGLSDPSAQGLHDLFGNAWEWVRDLLPSGKKANHHGRDYQFHALYGGGTFGQIGFDGYEPPADHVFVGRHDALGFRLTIPERTVNERMRSETDRSQESSTASP